MAKDNRLHDDSDGKWHRAETLSVAVRDFSRLREVWLFGLLSQSLRGAPEQRQLLVSTYISQDRSPPSR